jgi:putative membrane protein
MNEAPYGEFSEKELMLRDNLAITRTTLANERTLLAYLRTALALWITGVSLIKFFDSAILHITGWVFVASGIGAAFIGASRYRRITRKIKKAVIQEENK